MKEIVDYGKVFKVLVEETKQYILNNDIKAMILGISGGIDSTVVAAICHEVSKETGIPLIGRSLPTKFNKNEEISTAKLVGNAFCTDFEEVPIKDTYESFTALVDRVETVISAVANGNIQARLRMIYLYHLASIYKGIVMDTDNLTENNLGYFTIHGDVGDFNPIGCLWKTEVFKLAEWLLNTYNFRVLDFNLGPINKTVPTEISEAFNQGRAIKESLKLQPTAGLGITDNDLEELGADSYEQVDYILQEILAWKWVSLEYRKDKYNSIAEMQEAFLEEQAMLNMPIEVIVNITKRHFSSEFKRKQLPIKINREEITQNKIVQ